MLSLQTYLIVLPLVFLGGLIDSIAGGGGLISLPAYLAAGLPPHAALANNKFSSCFGTLLSAWRYHRSRLIDVRVALLSAAAALFGSAAGARTVLIINPAFLNYLLLVMIPLVTVFTLLHPNLGRISRHEGVPLARKYGLAAMAGLCLGFYDGFFGPGMGSFLILFFTLFLKYDLVGANANTKVVNLASNAGSLVTFILHAKVIYLLGVPAAAAGIAGNWVGSHLVLRKGGRLIRPIFIAVLLLLLGKIVYNLLTRP